MPSEIRQVYTVVPSFETQPQAQTSASHKKESKEQWQKLRTVDRVRVQE